MGLLDYLNLVEHARKLWRYLSTRKFRQVFGRDVRKEFHLIYNINVVPQGTVFNRPEPKVQRENYRRTQNLKTVNSCATTRAIGHLVYGFGKMVDIPLIISSDVDTDERMDMSFISVGGVTNLKTCDVLRDNSNHFLDYRSREPSIVHRSSGQAVAKPSTNVAYGFIVKIHPNSNRERTWICCAGFEEWGTSGAAWFLANKWKDIHKWAKGKPFAIITETEYQSDESTQLVHRFLTSDEVGDPAKRFAATVTGTTQSSSKAETIHTTCTASPGAMQ